jgi:hypothetical protein
MLLVLASKGQLQVMEQHLEAFFSGAPQEERQRCEGLNRISCMLERAERQFQQLVGDPHSAASQRSHFPVGRLASLVQSSEILEDVAEDWVLNEQANPFML